MTDTLTEHVADWRAQLAVDPVARLVQNVALTGRDSRNGYCYAESALRAALPLYDGKPVFLDHAVDRSRPRDRSTRDLVGTIESPRFEDGRVRADIRLLDTDSGRTFLALAQSNAPGVGMSHVVLAQRSADGTTVESIADVISVDAVINPATTTTFRESTDPASTFETPADSPAPRPSDSVAGSAPELAAVTRQLHTLESRLAVLELQREQEVHAQRMDALLSSSNLPDYALTPRFRQLLADAPTDADRHDLIRERADLLEHVSRLSPCSQPRTSDDTRLSTNAFLHAIKRR